MKIVERTMSADGEAAIVCPNCSLLSYPKESVVVTSGSSFYRQIPDTNIECRKCGTVMHLYTKSLWYVND